MSVKAICKCNKCGKTNSTILPNTNEIYFLNYKCDGCFYEGIKKKRK